MKPVFYLCKCGCKVPVNEIKKYQKCTNAERFCQLRCPEHQETEHGRVIEYIFECQRCKKHFSAGRGSVNCLECRDIVSKDKKRAYALDYYYKNPNKFVKTKRSRGPVDGKIEWVDCPMFGNGKACGAVCTKDNFNCRVYDNI